MLLAMGDIYIQILFSGYNLILVKAFGCGKKLLTESDSGNCFGMETKGFPVFRLFPNFIGCGSHLRFLSSTMIDIPHQPGQKTH